MRKIIFESAVSLDGFIEGPNGELGWWIPWEEYVDANTFLSTFDTIFCGRKAYEKLLIVSSSNALTGGQRQFLETVKCMRKYVFSRARKHVPGNGMVVSGDLEGEVRRIREEDGKCIWFCGGADIFKTFASLDLIDEYVFSIYPVALRSGKLLFEEKGQKLKLELLDRRSLKSGVLKLRYRPQNRVNKSFP